jgi:fructuronate reductase
MTLPRLSRATLSIVPDTVRQPDFDASRIATGIVHIGIGAFARAHLMWYTQPLLAADPSWGILGVSLRSAATRDALAPQDWLYTCADLLPSFSTESTVDSTGRRNTLSHSFC